jgi:hypothetical protein
VTIIDALRDRALFGALPPFWNLQSWSRWLVFLKATYGLPLTADEQSIFTAHTGRTTYDPPPGGWREVACIVGRQSGKTRIAATIAAFEAALGSPERDGTELYALLVAQDQRAALRALFSYARAPFVQIDLLQQAVERQTADSIGLNSGVTLTAYPCRPAAVRGLRARVIVADELAFYRSTENLPIDAEMLRACRPCLATTGGRLIILSSPYAQTGALYELHRRYFGRDDAPVLVWQATAPQMNPTLPADYLARMEADDPDAYRSEVLGEFRSGVATFLDPEAIAACVAPGERERAPAAGVSYRAFTDPSGGSGKDRFTLAVAHAEGERAVLDVCRAWRPPFNPSGVIEEAAAILKTYRVTEVVGDRFAGGFPPEGFREHAITYRASTRDRSAIYLDVQPLINSGRASLLDLPDLLREFRGLERRRGTSGRDRIDHAPGQHDDLANAASGALLEAGVRRTEPRVRGFDIPPPGGPWGLDPRYR